MKYLISTSNGLAVVLHEQLSDRTAIIIEPDAVISDAIKCEHGRHAVKLSRANIELAMDSLLSSINGNVIFGYDQKLLDDTASQLTAICSEHLNHTLSHNGWKSKATDNAPKLGKKKMLVCFSGGRTSAYMTDRLLNEYSDQYDFAVCFANTGWEHEKTLKFVNECDRRWGGVVVWLEAVTHAKKGVAPTHKVTNYLDAARDLEPFHAMCHKQGIPNSGYPHCTRDLKEYPIKSYLASIGWKLGKVKKGEIILPDYETAIGIRIDEPNRIKRNLTVQNKIYPLVDMFPTDKIDVNDFWEQQPFNLEIPDYMGNCKGCFKKSMRKHKQVFDSCNAFLDADLLERCYSKIGNNKIKGVNSSQPRTMYRNYMNAEKLIYMFDDMDARRLDDQDESSCGESCNAFENDHGQDDGYEKHSQIKLL